MQKGNEDTPYHIYNGVCPGILSIGEHLLYQSHNLAGDRSLRIRDFVPVDNQCSTCDNRNQNRTDQIFDRRYVGRIDQGDDGKADKTLIAI